MTLMNAALPNPHSAGLKGEIVFGGGSYPQSLRSPAPEGRRSGVMDNFRWTFLEGY